MKNINKGLKTNMNVHKYTYLRSQISNTGLIGSDEKHLGRQMTLDTETVEDSTPKSNFSRLYAPKPHGNLKDVSTTIISKFISIRRRPFTKQDLISSMQRFKACRDAERNDLMRTVNLTNRPQTIYSSRSNFSVPTTQTIEAVLESSKQERRLLNYDKTLKTWDKRSEILSSQCRRHKSGSLMERSDLHAIKMQELIELSKISSPCENTDAYYQWISSLRESKQHDQNRRVFLPLTNKNSINS